MRSAANDTHLDLALNFLLLRLSFLIRFFLHFSRILRGQRNFGKGMRVMVNSDHCAQRLDGGLCRQGEAGSLCQTEMGRRLTWYLIDVKKSVERRERAEQVKVMRWRARAERGAGGAARQEAGEGSWS